MIVIAVRVYMTVVDKEQSRDQLKQRGLLFRGPTVMICGADAEDTDAMSVMPRGMPTRLRYVPCAQDAAVRIDDIMVGGRLRVDVSSVSSVDDDIIDVSWHGF